VNRETERERERERESGRVYLHDGAASDGTERNADDDKDDDDLDECALLSTEGAFISLISSHLISSQLTCFRLN